MAAYASYKARGTKVPSCGGDVAARILQGGCRTETRRCPIVQAMRTVLLALGIVAAGLFATSAIADFRVELPPLNPSVEPVCVETMRRSAPDISWIAPGRESRIRDREIHVATLGELLIHNGDLVRVAGVLHAEFEWVALYSSRAAMDDDVWRAPWVSLNAVWPRELAHPVWETARSISDRCVVVEGTYMLNPFGHSGIFNGRFTDVLRLDVWSAPHRPFRLVHPPAPPPPAP